MKNDGSLGSRVGVYLGQGIPSYQIASSAIIAIASLFYVYTAASQLHLRVYPLVHRITYYANFEAYIINQHIDYIVLGGLLVAWLVILMRRSRLSYVGIAVLAVLVTTSAILAVHIVLDIIALASLPIVIAVFILSTYDHSRKITRSVNYRLTIEYVSIVAIFAGSISLVYAIFDIVTGNPLEMPLRNYAYDIFLILSSFSPILMLLLIVCVPVKVVIDFIRGYIKKCKTLPNQTFFRVESEVRLTFYQQILLVSLFMLLSIIVAVIPHLHTINKNDQQVSVDTGYYVNWISALKHAHDINDLLYESFVNQNGGDRPLSLLFLYGVDQATKSDLFIAIEYVGVILGPILVLVIYFLTRELTSSTTTSLTAAFLTAVSFHILIGIYAGFYANWIALILGYLSFIFLFRFLKRGKSENLLVYGILTVMTLFAHVYTWSILSIVGGLYLAVILLRPSKFSSGTRRNAVLLLVVLVSTVGLDIGRSVIAGASGGVERDLELANTLVSSEYFSLRWNHITYTTTTFVGGIFANFLVLGLGLYWLAKAKLFDTTTIFLMVFFSIGILPFLVGDWIVQTRVFYNMPFQIPAAISLTYLRKYSFKHILSSSSILIWLAATAGIFLSNFYLAKPVLLP